MNLEKKKNTFRCTAIGHVPDETFSSVSSTVKGHLVDISAVILMSYVSTGSEMWKKSMLVSLALLALGCPFGLALGNL
jgi:hypothetical protein